MPRIRIPKSWGPEKALTVAYVFNDVARAIWKTHGHALADYLQCLLNDGRTMPRSRIVTRAFTARVGSQDRRKISPRIPW